MPSEAQARPCDVRTALQQAMARLRAAQVPSHTLAAELLLMSVLSQNRAWLYAHPEETLDPSAVKRYFELVARRAAGTPTQYLTGRQEFWGLSFHVEPGVLIPRPETEHVVEVALEQLGPPDPASKALRGTGLRIVDVGTGSGCIAVALAHELPGAEIFATDISAQALAIARRNASRHSALIQFVQCDLLTAFHQSPVTNHQSPFHLIVSNPPYVSRAVESELPREVREHEPAPALFGGSQGHEVYPPLIEQAGRLLASGGILVLELGHDSLEQVRPLLWLERGWTRLGVTNDLAGIPRVISARRL